MNTISSLLRRSGWAGALALTALLGTAGASSAASYTVLNTGSAGPDTLQAAIAAAQADSDASDTITFAPGVTGTISTGGTELAINKSLTITGPGASVLTIDAGNAGRVFHVYSGTVLISGLRLTNGNASSINGGGLQVENGSSVTLENMTVDHCTSTTAGGGLANEGSLTVLDSTLSANTGLGAGVYNDGTASLARCTLTGNNANGNAGGGVYCAQSITLTNCTLTGNSAYQGGAIFDSGGSASLVSCTVTGNTATSGQGGGLWVAVFESASLQACIVSGNTNSNLYGSVDAWSGQTAVINSNGSNLLGDGDEFGFANGSNHDQTGVSNPMLSALASYGGPTQTLRPQAGSPALNADYSGATSTDQRGVARTGSTHTIGAVEGAGPTTVADSYTATENTALIVAAAAGLLANDIEPTGAPLSTVLITGPSHGTLVLNPDGSFVYTPGMGFSGTDSFTYAAADADGNGNTATVTLTVTHVAATLVVTNNLDDGSPGSLRSVLASAGPGDTITFASNVLGTITLVTGEMTISQDLTITGPGAGVLAIDGGGTDRLFDITAGTVAISGLTLQNGSVPGNGGAIDNAGALTFIGVLSGNSAQFGGAISNENGGSVTLTSSTFSGNTSLHGGSVLWNAPVSTAAILGCTFAANTAGDGGAVTNEVGSTATVTDSTFFGNTAGYGELCNDGGAITLTSCTLSANVGTVLVGGINNNGGVLTLTATVITGSTLGDLASENGGTVISGGSNLLGDGDEYGIVGGTINDQTGVSTAQAKIGPLAANGGPTSTCAVLAGSPAIGGDFALLTSTDQRGIARTAAQHTIGAFEYTAPAMYTHLLWTNTDGRALIANIGPDGTPAPAPVYGTYGPFTNWAAKSIATGPDGASRLLWSNTDGTSAVWTVDSAGTALSTPAFGPYAGWSVAGLAVGPDNLTRLQWKRAADGMSSVWTVAADGSFLSTVGYGPYGPSGEWTVSGLGVGSDGLARLLWGNGSGQFSVWTVDGLGHTASTPRYAPAGGWTASAIASGPDTNSRLLLNRTDGAMAVWTVDLAGGVTSTPLFSPISGWGAVGLAVGPDALSRVLWSSTAGQSSVWTIAADGSIVSTPAYGPAAGWNATGISVGP